MSPAKRMYEPRIFEGRVMLPEEQEQIYEEIIQFERMEYVSPQMGELIMDVWPELAHKGAAERGLKPLYCFVTTIVARLARRDGPDSPLTITRPWPADPGRGFFLPSIRGPGNRASPENNADLDRNWRGGGQ
jgi:hypothetical protein